MPIPEQTEPALIAFRTAQKAARRMVVDTANIALASGLDEYLAEVRVALVDANRRELVGPLDYNGKTQCDVYLAADDAAAGAYWDQLSAREVSGYLLGLARPKRCHPLNPLDMCRVTVFARVQADRCTAGAMPTSLGHHERVLPCHATQRDPLAQQPAANYRVRIQSNAIHT
jgi:hypothetical protein